MTETFSVVSSVGISNATLKMTDRGGNGAQATFTVAFDKTNDSWMDLGKVVYDMRDALTRCLREERPSDSTMAAMTLLRVLKSHQAVMKTRGITVADVIVFTTGNTGLVHPQLYE